MRLGIGSYTFPWAVGVPGFPPPSHPLTRLELLEKAAAAGVRVVQIADNLPLHPLTDRELDLLRQQATERSVTLEIGTRGIHRDHLRRYLQIAARLESKLIRVLIDTATHRPEVPEIVAELSVVAPALAHQGAKLAIENHDRLKAVTLREIFDRVGSPNIGLCFDTANSLGCMEGVDQVIATLAPYVLNVHLKDVRVARLPHKHGFLVEGAPAGEGDLDIPQLLTCIRAAGRDPNVILELWPPAAATTAAAIATEEDWAARSLCFLRQHIAD